MLHHRNHLDFGLALAMVIHSSMQSPKSMATNSNPNFLAAEQLKEAFAIVFQQL